MGDLNPGLHGRWLVRVWHLVVAATEVNTNTIPMRTNMGMHIKARLETVFHLKMNAVIPSEVLKPYVSLVLNKFKAQLHINIITDGRKHFSTSV